MSKTRFVMFIRGLPGAGKSTISSKISIATDCVLIDPDLIPDKNRKSLREERLRKYRICLINAERAINGDSSVVWSQPWRKIQNIQITIDHLDNNSIKFLLVNINIPVEESWKRSKDNFLNDRVDFDDYISKFVYFHNNFNIKSVDIDGMISVNENIEKLIKFLRYNIGDE